MAKVFARRIKNHSEVTRCVLLSHPFQHVNEAEDRVGRNAFGRAQFPHRIEGAVDVRLPVDEKNSYV